MPLLEPAHEVKLLVDDALRDGQRCVVGDAGTLHHAVAQQVDAPVDDAVEMQLCVGEIMKACGDGIVELGHFREARLAKEEGHDIEAAEDGSEVLASPRVGLLDLGENDSAMAAVGGGSGGIALEDLDASEEDADEQDEGLVAHCAQLADGGIVVMEGKGVVGQLGTVCEEAGGLVVEGADGDEGVADGGLKVRKLHHEVRPEVGVQWPCQHRTEAFGEAL